MLKICRKYVGNLQLPKYVRNMLKHIFDIFSTQPSHSKFPLPALGWTEAGRVFRAPRRLLPNLWPFGPPSGRVWVQLGSQMSIRHGHPDGTFWVALLLGPLGAQTAQQSYTLQHQ